MRLLLTYCLLYWRKSALIPDLWRQVSKVGEQLWPSSFSVGRRQCWRSAVGLAAGGHRHRPARHSIPPWQASAMPPLHRSFANRTESRKHRPVCLGLNDIALHLRATERHLPYRLPATRHGWMRAASTPARQAGTRFTYSEERKTQLTLVLVITRWFTSLTNDHLIASRS